MCIVSMVHDQMNPYIPDVEEWQRPITSPPWQPVPKTVTITGPSPVADLSELKALIAEFRQMVDAAKFLDEKLKQPDCLDPEKAKLEDKIKQLESIIANPPEFVVVSGGGLEPGKYRVIDGKLYKAVE